MSYEKQGGAISTVYDRDGELIAKSDSPNYYWIFVREEPLDYIAKRVPTKGEVARLYIFQGMEINWA